ncbi:MAG: cytochrome c biogenesis protein CcsA [Phycisphaerales bacterium JB039]
MTKPTTLRIAVTSPLLPDPKETWALITWIIYLIVIHVRIGMGSGNKGLVTAILSVVGFVMMIWTYFGVNLLLPGLHAYA